MGNADIYLDGVKQGANVSILAGTQSIGKVGINAGTAVIGKITNAFPFSDGSASQTMVYVHLRNINSGVNDLHTVTTGKTFYLSGFNVASEANTGLVLFQNHAGSVYYGGLSCLTWSSAQMSSNVPIETIAAAVVISCNPSSNAWDVDMWGWEQ